MRRPFAAAALLAVAMLVSACAAAQAPGWTYAPPTPAPTPGPSQSAGASSAPSAVAPSASAAAPSAAQSAGASGGASAAAPSGSAAASGGSGGGSATTLKIVALNIAFDQTTLSAPANTAFTIHFDNQDSGIPHNVTIKDASGADIFKPDTITGPATVDYNVPALKPGTYTFYCIVHPNMTGTLTVGG